MKKNETRIKEGRFSPKLSAIHEIEIETYLKEKAKPPTFVYLKYIMDFAHLILQLIFFLCAVGATTVASVSLPEIDLRSSSNKYDVVIASIFPELGPTCGGTDIVLTIRRSIVDGGVVDRYSDDLACAFMRETDATATMMTMMSTLARWMSTTEILCATPKWTVNDDNVTLNLISTNGTVVAT